MDYKSRLQTLHLLPLIYHFELNDILFFINSIKNPSRNFSILHYLHFTKSSSHSKLVHSSASTNTGSHFYFIRFPRLWNSIPPLDLTLSVNTLKNTIINLFWSNLCNLTDDVTTCPMMTSLCRRVNNVRFCLGFRWPHQYDDITMCHFILMTS